MSAGSLTLRTRDRSFALGWMHVIFIALTVSVVIALAAPEHLTLLPYFVFLAFCIQLIRVRDGLLDPLLIFCLGTFVYGFFPLLADTDADSLIGAFGLEGGRTVYLFAMHALAAAYFVSERAFKSVAARPRALPEADPAPARESIAYSSFVLCAGLSIFLEGVYWLQHGAVLTGRLDYAEAFRERATTGAGILLLSYPIGMTGLCFMLTSKHRFKLYSYLVSLPPFALLFLVHGERKYFVAPALTIAARFIRARKIAYILAGLAATAFAWIVFSYLGYLRTFDYSVFDMFNEGALTGYMNDFSYQIAGETPSLFATASAAYAGFVAPLPYFGDYLLSWTMAAPQFIFGQNVFVPMADRFAMTFAPDRAAEGMGWGFSFWGETYLVLGLPGIYLMAIVIALIFRFVRVKGLAQGLTGPFGAALLAALYQGLWLNRSDLAHFTKDYLIYELFIIFAVYKAGATINAFLKPR